MKLENKCNKEAKNRFYAICKNCISYNNNYCDVFKIKVGNKCFFCADFSLKKIDREKFQISNKLNGI